MKNLKHNRIRYFGELFLKKIRINISKISFHTIEYYWFLDFKVMCRQFPR
jgi:hypothetical protein